MTRLLYRFDMLADPMPQIEAYERGYTVDRDANGEFIRCHACGKASYHPKDISEKFCGYCDKFHRGATD